ncbi:protein-disulfide reductase DsbD domain-containing protein [Cohaesibacter haloalkalitolerans]|uniref:protein-disulfide reductase DsbD domain-containing protein n=1 Tax=Cohaesibacter haloalkalitolerans TaxID=1162980 RepID=UPI000E64DE2E|nr:protein-disulfide reductase DsbD domain-containing protein [Cohaesibacter haloalkalitolerans]
MNDKFKNFFALTTLVAALLSPVLAAAAVSEWQEAEGGRMRLVAAGQKDGVLKAGLEIELDDGWKTYWKVPGDTGLPPDLDNSASENVAKIETLWPVPHRIKAGGTEILGYKEGIIFPFLVTPKDSQQPVTLNLAAQIGLCAELCVPLYAEMTLDFPGAGSHDLATELLIDRDMALVPSGPREDFRIDDIHEETAADGSRRLLIAAQIPDGYGKKDLFVEAPEGWYLPLTSHMENNVDGRELFSLSLEGMPKDAKTEGARLTFTLTNGDDAVVETKILQE